MAKNEQTPKKAAKKSTKGKRIPAKQGKSQVGYKKPPEETRFNKGESGNPAGPPARRTQLWVWFCKFMDMTDNELGKLKREVEVLIYHLKPPYLDELRAELIATTMPCELRELVQDQTYRF